MQRPDALAQGEGHTSSRLAIAWLSARRPVASVIAGATKPEQVPANVAAVRWHPGPETCWLQVDVIVPRWRPRKAQGSMRKAVTLI